MDFRKAPDAGPVELGKPVGKIVNAEHPGIHSRVMKPSKKAGELQVEEFDVVVL
jgi:hypothetical protein